MKHNSFRIADKASISVGSMLGRKNRGVGPSTAIRAAGFSGTDPEAIHETDLVSVLVEVDPDAGFDPRASLTTPDETMEALTDTFMVAQIGEGALRTLVDEPRVQRIQSMKEHQPTLDAVTPDVGLVVPPSATRQVPETGKGVLIGVVDTGFDLTHPMFHDTQGRFRVEALLDQTAGNREFSGTQLEDEWRNGRRPGGDEDGHGTHVAGIAGGSDFNGRGGIAPDARFLLVRTDFRNTAAAVSWIFQKAKNRPCVVNMSLGHHHGAHDGTDAEERLHQTLVGPGRIIVVSAGNERNDRLHIGARMVAGQSETVMFDVLRPQDRAPFAILNFWYDQKDEFDLDLITPGGQMMPTPALGVADNYRSAMLDIEISRRRYVWSSATQVQVSLSFQTLQTRHRDLRDWGVRIVCRKAAVGRIDGWFHNSGFGSFRDHPFMEEGRTIGLPATGSGCIAVASHVTRNEWSGDLGAGADARAVVGRISPFSSSGPTRDGRWKPEISAPGQYLTSALADGCNLSRWDERALVNERLVTIEGTSMSAPVVAGVVALLLQRKTTLTVDQVRDTLSKSARRDTHTGPAQWDPAYGFGKVDVARALALL